MVCSGMPLECLGLRGFRYRLLSSIIAPVALTLLSATAAAGWVRLTRGRVPRAALVEAALPWALRVLFLTYPAVTNVACAPARPPTAAHMWWAALRCSLSSLPRLRGHLATTRALVWPPLYEATT